MSNKTYNIIHKRGTSGIEPNPNILDYGEIAVKYSTNNEKLFVKNDSNNIVSFPTDTWVSTQVSNAIASGETSVNQLSGNVHTAITDEATARQSGDTALNVSVNNLNNRVLLLEDILRQHGWL